MTNVCNYADDTTFHACDSDLEILIQRLEHDSVLAIEWFEGNYMKLNNDKCHVFLSGYKHEVMWANIGQSQIWGSKEQKRLGDVIDKGTWWSLMNIFKYNPRKQEGSFVHLEEYVNF